MSGTTDIRKRMERTSKIHEEPRAMTAEQLDQFIEIADEYGIEAEPYDGPYSGRGMYGETTFAAVLSGKESDAHWIAGAMTVRNESDSRVKFRTDSLGNEVVVY
jgi:hypothetical protein